MLLLHLSRTPIFCNKNCCTGARRCGSGILLWFHLWTLSLLPQGVGNPKFSFSEFGCSEFSTEGTGREKFHEPEMSLVSIQILDQNGPGTNIESQHSRALRGQSGAGTGPGDEVKGLSYRYWLMVPFLGPPKECIWGNFIATSHRRIGHPKKVVNSKGIPQMRCLC